LARISLDLEPPHDGDFFLKQTPRERLHHCSFVTMKEREKAESEGGRKIGWTGDAVMRWGSSAVMEAWGWWRLGVREAAEKMWERERKMIGGGGDLILI
jgi:hypothetical protein